MTSMSVCCVAGLGTATRAACAVPPAAGSTPASGSLASVFVWCVRPHLLDADYWSAARTLHHDHGRSPDVDIGDQLKGWTYTGKPTKVNQVAQELGVRYILEGSVQRQGNQVRINAHLIDGIGGQHVWA